MKTICVIQARLGSERLPGKMLMKLGGLSIIEWVILRVKKSIKINQIFLATTTKDSDNELSNIALKNDILVFKGSEDDVLSRFVEISKISNADNIVRVCADNPFIAPEEIDKLINYFTHNQFDYACNHKEVLKNGYVDGFGAEIISRETLLKVGNMAIKKEHLEHVTSYIWDNQDQFKISALQPTKEMTFPSLSFDVDTMKDLIELTNLVSKFNITTDTRAIDIIKFKNQDLKN
jgi:spore coat polysaccharide biosynthesis protein SpsF